MAEPGFRPKPLEEIFAPRSSRVRTVEYRRRPGERKPMWAILGEEAPYDWRSPEAQDNGGFKLAAAKDTAGDQAVLEPGSISNPGVQRGPGIWVVEHPSLGAGPAHTAIEYVSENGDRAWISAGPYKGRLVSGVGMQEKQGKARGKRPTDAPEGNVTVERISPPKGMTNADLWGEIKRRDANYRDNVDYDLFPEIQDSYNSYSYTRGLLDASGATYTVPFDHYVGGNDPLPSWYFDAPRLQDWGASGSLRPPYRRRLPGAK